MIDITKNVDDGVLVLGVVGDVDASSSIELDNAIKEALEEGSQKIIVNCKNLSYISSAGLGVFMSYIQELESKNVKMVICHLNEKVEGVFQILGLDQLLKIVSSEDEAKKIINEL